MGARTLGWPRYDGSFNIRNFVRSCEQDLHRHDREYRSRRDVFSMSASQDEYVVERWDSKEIVASSVVGLCKVRNVIKFDLVQKRVLFMQTLSEPIDDLPKATARFLQDGRHASRTQRQRDVEEMRVKVRSAQVAIDSTDHQSMEFLDLPESKAKGATRHSSGWAKSE